MTKLIYITHPSVTLDKNIPIEQWGLSQSGYEAVERLLLLPFIRDIKILYASTETKATQVADLLASKLGISYEAFDELKESDRSSTGLIPFDEYMEAIQFAYKNPDESFKGWETHRSNMNRNVKKIQELVQLNVSKTIGIIGHGGSGSLIKCWLKGKEPDFHEDPQKTGCYWIAEIDTMSILTDWTAY